VKFGIYTGVELQSTAYEEAAMGDAPSRRALCDLSSSGTAGVTHRMGSARVSR
jgi:hypothetical protein